MAKYSAQLKATSNQGKTVTTNISNVNPEAEPLTIKQFAQQLNTLTVNTYDSTDYIITTNLDTETPPIPTPKTEPTLTVTPEEHTATVSWANSSTDSGSGRYYTISYNGDGQLYAYTNVIGLCVGITPKRSGVMGTFLAVKLGFNGEDHVTTYTAGTIYICATEGDDYAAKTIELPFE